MKNHFAPLSIFKIHGKIFLLYFVNIKDNAKWLSSAFPNCQAQKNHFALLLMFKLVCKIFLRYFVNIDNGAKWLSSAFSNCLPTKNHFAPLFKFVGKIFLRPFVNITAYHSNNILHCCRYSQNVLRKSFLQALISTMAHNDFLMVGSLEMLLLINAVP